MKFHSEIVRAAISEPPRGNRHWRFVETPQRTSWRHKLAVGLTLCALAYLGYIALETAQFYGWL